MTRSVSPPQHEVPESALRALHSLYREAAAAEPGSALDRSILDAARAELRGDSATTARRLVPWWKGWLPVTSAIAVAVVGLSVTWRVMDEQERQLREEMRAVPAKDERARREGPAQGPVETKPPFKVRTPAAEKSHRADSAELRDAPTGRAEPESRPAASLAAPVAPAAPAPTVMEDAMKKGRRAETDDAWERRDASNALEAISRTARQVGKLEAGAGAATADVANPEAWLKEIRELRAAGRVAEAAQSLARFRARYPDSVVPDDLLNLK